MTFLHIAREKYQAGNNIRRLIKRCSKIGV